MKYTQKNNSVQKRRGVTLMLVLALMSLFAMLVATFMVVTTQARFAAETAAKALLEPKDPTAASGGFAASASVNLDAQTAFAQAMRTLLFGDDFKTVIGPYSILENLYGTPEFGGNDPLKGSTQNNVYTVINSGNVVALEIGWNLSNYYGSPHASANGYRMCDLAGHVLTISSIPGSPSNSNTHKLENQSTLIIGYNDNNGRIIIAPFAHSGVTPADQQTALNTDQCEYIINTPAFSGTGPGFDSTKTSVDATLSAQDADGVPYALRPNVLAPNSANPNAQDLKANLQNNLVLMNPDYTAPDLKSLFLAWYEVTGNSSEQIERVIPSFHRPQLIGTQNPSTWNELRKLVLRPLPGDHPNFSGSNPALDGSLTFAKITEALANGPFDVDNDDDGIADGIWLNIGLPALDDTVSNKKYLPLVSFLVRDMDGRLNVNAHGNLGQTNDNFGKYDDTSLDIYYRTSDTGSLELVGSGAGPAEVRLDNLLSSNLKNILSGDGGLQGKYTNTNGPGSLVSDADSGADATIKTEMGENMNAYSLLNNGVGDLRPDWHGFSPLLFDPLGNRVVQPLNQNQLFAYNPYLMNPAPNGSANRFTEADLQLILRSPGDTDYFQLSTRLRSLLKDRMNGSLPSAANWSDYRHSFTSHSSDIPVFSRFGGSDSKGSYTGFYDYILSRVCDGNADRARKLYTLLPPEVRRGEKINLNKLTLDPDWTTGGNHAAMLLKKAQFAQSIFYLLLVLNYENLFDTTPYTETGFANRDDIIKRLAQWSVNLVDFIDADGVMTPFVYSVDPFAPDSGNANDFAEELDKSNIISGLISNGNSLADLEMNERLIFGFEKPQLALTETLAVHNRRVANSKQYGTETNDLCEECGIHCRFCVDCPGKSGNPHATTFRQVLDPEASLFVELYHPGNPQRSQYPNDKLHTAEKLNLSAMSGGTTPAPVWRMVVGKRSSAIKIGDKWNKSESSDFLAQLEDDPENFSIDKPTTAFVPERYLWFGTPSSTAESDEQYYTTNAGITMGANEHIIIGPRIKTSFASNTSPSETEYGTQAFIDQEPNPDDFEDEADYKAAMADYEKMARSVIEVDYVLEDSTGKGVNVSAPLEGYNISDRTKPAEKDEDLAGIGTIPCYRTIVLQRLADPLREFNEETNPYVTVDWNMIDLHVINSEERKLSEEEKASAKPGKDITKWNDEPGLVQSDIYFKTRQWGFTTKNESALSDCPKYPNLWDRSIKIDAGKFDTACVDALYAGLGPAQYPQPADQKPSRWHFHEDATFGELNHFLTKSGRVKIVSGGNFTDVPNPGFQHFPWNDTPFTNVYEIMMVPACSYDRFCFEFHDTETDPTNWNAAKTSLGSGLRFVNPDSDIGPYLNFFQSDATQGNSLNLAQLFEYVRVPSRFAGTIRWINGNPVYEMREPGKINLNTMTEKSWNALTNQDSARYDNYSVFHGTVEDTGTTAPETFINPFRSPQSVNLVSDSNLLAGAAVQTTLLRPGSGTDPLIKPNTAGNKGTNPYTELENVMRLSDVTTNRSNVFAVWMTIGLFEVDKYSSSSLPTGIPSSPTAANFDAIYPDGYVLGKERGLDDGSVRRYRAFSLIDRSIPVGFRRGQMLNAENVIIQAPSQINTLD